MASPTIDFPALLAKIGDGRSARLIVGVAGAPGSGKSTLAEALVDGLNAAEPGSAAILPMDGFHYDDSVLRELGLYARKGAPATFDVGGLRHLLWRLKQNREPTIAVPVFDRALEISRAGGRLISQSVRRVVVEGNYLLLDEAPWSALHDHFDITVMIEVPEPVLRERLTARWHGYGLPPDEIARKVEGNDLPNGVMVARCSVAPTYRLP